MAETYIGFEAPSQHAEEATAAFWRAVEASGIPHTDVDPDDFGTTVITVASDYILQLEEIARAHGGFLDKIG